MAEPEGMDELRARVVRAEQDAAAARYLAGGADRDVGETRTELRGFRAETRAEFVAVRAEMRSEFADVRAELRGFRDQNNRVLSALRADMVEGFRQVDDKFTQVRGMLDAQAAWNQRLADMLGVLIQQQDGEEPHR